MTFYKATRPDGTSFHDSTTTWKVGRITRLEGTKRNEICGSGILHASKEPGEVLVGGSWPCRLFVVEPRTRVIESTAHRYKVGAYAWKVVEELPAHQALGPNGGDVQAIIERAATITYEEGRRLAAAWAAVWAAERAAAGAAAGDAARAAARAAPRDAARAAPRAAARDAAWDAAWDAAGDAAWDAAGDAAWDAAPADVRAAAGEAAWAAEGAAGGVLASDLISDAQFNTLVGPWERVIGIPDAVKR